MANIKILFVCDTSYQEQRLLIFMLILVCYAQIDLQRIMHQQSEQHTKFQLNNPQEKLTITAITWNLFGQVPPHQSLTQLFTSPRLNPLTDIIFFGTQECQRSLGASFCCEDKDVWENMLIQHCKTHFLAICQTMRGLHIAVLIKQSLREYFQFQKKQKMRAGGPCGLMGNKGAISIEFSLLGQQFQFINCHLAANQQYSQARNATISRILQEVISDDKSTQVIFLGDFNYRIDMEKVDYKKQIEGRQNTNSQMNYLSRLSKDQLINQKELSNFLKLFQEGPINFPPTYKIGVNSKQYNSERIPGWTDRIFHRKSGKMTRSRYFCEYQIIGSDHRPVIACYQRILEEHSPTIQSQNFVGVKSGQKCQLI